MGDVMHSMVHRLIGCEWGRKIIVAGDMAKCPQQAVQRVALHGEDQGACDGPIVRGPP